MYGKLWQAEAALRALEETRTAAPVVALPPAEGEESVLSDALRWEMAIADGMVPLPMDARRRHVHYTHYRTQNPEDIQPWQLTREQFWNHMSTCFLECYPDTTSPTGSFLQFGAVAKELHNDAEKEEDRSEHHHCPTFASNKYYWKKVRNHSAEKYHIQLNAVAHEGYSTMFMYVRVPTAKKPLHELDAQLFLSPGHPEGAELAELLKNGAKYMQVRSGRQPGEASGSMSSTIAIVYNWVIDKKLRKRKGAMQLEADAVSEMTAGRPKLLEFVRRHQDNLEDQLEFCWRLHEAPRRMERLSLSRVEILRDYAFADHACSNGHSRCGEHYNRILHHQGVTPTIFIDMLYDALDRGRQKGNAVMVVGGKDTGKTTVTEPARVIFKSMATPQADSFCPLEACRGYELFLWQDFRFAPGHPRKDEQGLRLDEGTWNRLLEGLPARIGVAKSSGSKDFEFEEDVAFIFTGPFELTAYRNGLPDAVETAQLSCRMRYIHFSRPSPQSIDRKFKTCAACWSKWLLQGVLYSRRVTNTPLDPFLRSVSEGFEARGLDGAAASVPSAEPLVAQPEGSDPAPNHGFDRLREIMMWKSQGLLTDAEFAAAKSRLLGLS